MTEENTIKYIAECHTNADGHNNLRDLHKGKTYIVHVHILDRMKADVYVDGGMFPFIEKASLEDLKKHLSFNLSNNRL